MKNEELNPKGEGRKSEDEDENENEEEGQNTQQPTSNTQHPVKGRQLASAVAGAPGGRGQTAATPSPRLVTSSPTIGAPGEKARTASAMATGMETRGQDARATIGRGQTAEIDEIKAVAAEMEGWRDAAGGSIVELLAEWVAGQYLLANKKQLASLPEGPERVKLLHQAAGDVAALQRGGRFAARLKLDREKLEFERQKHKEMLAATETKMRERPDYFRPLTDAERLAIVDKVDEVMGLK